VDGIVDGILDHQVDGIVAASVALGSELTARCRAAGVPVVLLNRSQDDPTLSAVTSDNVGGGRKVAELLLAGGHERIAYVAGWEGASTQRDREFGFRAGLAQGGAALHARAVGDFRLEGAREAARALFGGADRPDAVFVANDHMAFGVMDVLRFEMGLCVPGDVSVVGYDDVPPASWPAYDLTTVRQAPGRMVAETVAILIDRIEQGDDEPRRIAIAADLVLRGSARIPPGWSR
jgi:DNA-binding LacI/PurR family transcriptional regulator